MCPNCRAFVTASDRICPYCNQQLMRRAVQTRDDSGLFLGLIPQTHFTTVIILIVS